MSTDRWWVVVLVGLACRQAPPDQSAPPSSIPPAPAAVAAEAVAAEAAAGLAPPIAVAAPTGAYRGPDCGPHHAPHPDRDDAPMCFQPGGTFLMGSPPGVGGPAEHPRRQVTLSPFFLDQFEVTRAQFAAFLNRAPHRLACDQIGPDMCPATRISRSPWALELIQDGQVHDWNRDRFTAGARAYAVRPGEARLPMEEVRIGAARAYCAWVGKTLPTNAQWEYAAAFEPQTGQVRRYPWGNVFRRGFANCSIEDCGDPRQGRAAAVDDFPRDVSATGVRGLAGNLAEWIAECATPTLLDCGACIDPLDPTPCTAAPSETAAHPRPRSASAEPPTDRELLSDPPHDPPPGGPTVRGGDTMTSADELRSTYRLGHGVSPDAIVGLRCATPAITAPAARAAPSP